MSPKQDTVLVKRVRQIVSEEQRYVSERQEVEKQVCKPRCLEAGWKSLEWRGMRKALLCHPHVTQV